MCLCWQASVVVLLFVYSSVRTRTQLLGTNLDIWIISVESSSFLSLPYPDWKANCPGKGLNQLPSLILFQEGHHGSCITCQWFQKNPNKNCLSHVSEREWALVLKRRFWTVNPKQTEAFLVVVKKLLEENADLRNTLSLLCLHWLAKGRRVPYLGMPV